MKMMRRIGKRRSRGAKVGMDQDGQVMQKGRGSRWETVGRKTIGGKEKETEMATEEGNEEKGEKVGRVPRYLQHLHHPLPLILPTSHPRKKPRPKLARRGLELCRKSLHRLDLLMHRAGQERTHHLTMDRVRPLPIRQGKTWRSQMRRRRRLP